MYDDFRDLHEAGAKFTDLGLYVLVTIPSFLALTLPIVLLVSILFVLGKLHKANELTAMRAAGVGYRPADGPHLAGGRGLLRPVVLAELLRRSHGRSRRPV